MRRVAMVSMLLLSAVLWASPRGRSPASSEPEDGGASIAINVMAGANLWATLASSTGRSNTRVSFLGGGELYWYFSEHVGLFTGMHLTSRGQTRAGTTEVSAPFMDVPFGIGFRYGGRFFGSQSHNQFNLGGYYGIPLGALHPTNTPTMGAFGIYVGASTLFPVGHQFTMGFATWAKYGLSDCVQADLANGVTGGTSLEVGIGLIFGFG